MYPYQYTHNCICHAVFSPRLSFPAKSDENGFEMNSCFEHHRSIVAATSGRWALGFCMGFAPTIPPNLDRSIIYIYMHVCIGTMYVYYFITVKTPWLNHRRGGEELIHAPH